MLLFSVMALRPLTERQCSLWERTHAPSMRFFRVFPPKTLSLSRLQLPASHPLTVKGQLSFSGIPAVCVCVCACVSAQTDENRAFDLTNSRPELWGYCTVVCMSCLLQSGLVAATLSAADCSEWVACIRAIHRENAKACVRWRWRYSFQTQRDIFQSFKGPREVGRKLVNAGWFFSAAPGCCFSVHSLYVCINMSVLCSQFVSAAHICLPCGVFL